MASESPRPIFLDPRLYFELSDEEQQAFAEKLAAQLLQVKEGEAND